MTYKEIVKKKEYFQNITWIHLSNCLKAFENRELLSASIWSAVFVESMLKDILSVLLNVNISTEEISSLIARLRNILHIAKLNGRICGAKRSHSVFEQPNCYQSV